MYLFNINPRTAPRMTRSDAWAMSSGRNLRKPVADYMLYRDKLNIEARTLKFVLPEQLIIEFYIAMPDSWSKKKKAEMKNTPHREHPDIDNLIKGFMDALSIEDKNVWNVQAVKIWSITGTIVVRDALVEFEKKEAV